jgi:carbon storage regulator CsrA
MLVLQRLCGETITISVADGVKIVVTLVLAREGRARIGIDAPRHMEICRDDMRKDQNGKAIEQPSDGSDGGTPPDLAKLGITKGEQCQQ